MKKGEVRTVRVRQRFSYPGVMGGMLSYEHMDGDGENHDSCYGLPLANMWDGDAGVRDGAVLEVTVKVINAGKKPGPNPWKKWQEENRKKAR